MDLFTFDDEYVRRLAAGDPVTEDHFFRYFQELLFIKLRQRLRSMQAIDDVRQEVFARVFAKLHDEGKIREGVKLGAFVNGVCNNVLLEWYRSERKTEPLEETFDITDQMDLPDVKLATEETNAIVRKILDELPRKDADILRAKYIEDLSNEEIAIRFNVERGYLRVLFHRAKERFRVLYEKRRRTPRPPDETDSGGPSVKG